MINEIDQQILLTLAQGEEFLFWDLAKRVGADSKTLWARIEALVEGGEIEMTNSGLANDPFYISLTHVGSLHLPKETGSDHMKEPVQKMKFDLESLNGSLSTEETVQDTQVSVLIESSQLPDQPITKEVQEAFKQADNLTEGAFVVSRSLFKSEIWFKLPLYSRAWIWMLGRANHQEIKHGNFIYRRGEFYTTYNEIREDLAFYRENKKVKPSIQQMRDILNWCEANGMIKKIALKKSSNLMPTSGEPQATAQKIGSQRTDPGTYTGLRIKIINFDTYQNLKNYENRLRNRGSDERKNTGTTQGQHNNKNDKNVKDKIIGREQPPPDPRVKEFFDYWGETFLQEIGQPYTFSFGKEGKLVKYLLRVHSFETMKEITKLFFKDEQAKRRGLTIGILHQEINRLLSLKVMDPLEQAKRERLGKKE